MIGDRDIRLGRRAVLRGITIGSALSLLGVSRRIAFGQEHANNDLHVSIDEHGRLFDPQDCGPLAWNALLRRLVTAAVCDPPYASHVYAYVSLAQACAATTTEFRPRQASSSRPRGSPAARVALAAAASEIVTPLFREFLRPPEHYHEQISREARLAGLSPGEISDMISTGAGIGRRLGARMIHARDSEIIGAPASDDTGVWRPDHYYRPAVRPTWGVVSPLLVKSASFPVRPPPPVDSAEFRSALHEVGEHVRRTIHARSRIVALWADGMGTSTPPGHWNRIACQLARRHRVDELHALNALTLMNLAMFDAGILCWRVKFTYWLARPHQMDPSIRPLVQVPRFPAYPSGHSAFSAAASDVLAHFYPQESRTLAAMAAEASESRIAGGIHYRFDCDEGLCIGRWVADAAIRAWQMRKRFSEDVWLRPLDEAPTQG